MPQYLREAMNRTLMAKIGYIFAKGAFDRLREKMDPRKTNGGVFLGLNGVVIKSHGGTDAMGFASAIDVGYDMAHNKLPRQDRCGSRRISTRVRSASPSRTKPTTPQNRNDNRKLR